MWFKLNGTKDGSPYVLYYENISNDLRYENGEKVKFNQEPIKPENNKPIDFTPEESSCVKSLSVGHLEIVLGLKCNFKCEYCSQWTIRDKGNDISPAKARKLAEHLKRVRLKVRDSIQLWGGEPLVYKKSLFVLIPLLRELYPDVSISMPSNGSLLTDGLIDLFNRYKISYYVSTDGAETTQRGEAVEDDPKLNALFRRAARTMGRRFGFSTTPHQSTANSEKIISFLRGKVPEAKLIGTHNVIRCHKYGAGGIPESVFKMTDGQLKEYEDSVFNVLTNRELALLDLPLCRHANLFMFTVSSGCSNLAVAGECQMPTDGALVIDWEGNVYSCHSHTALEEKIGNIDEIEKVRNIGFTHWRHRRDCPSCPFLASCRGGCPRMGEREYLVSCPNLRALHKGIFRAFFKSAFGMEISGIERVAGE